MTNPKNTLLVLGVMLLATACGETTREAERNLDLLRSRARSLDSLINVESQRVKMLDSTIADEFTRAGKLDSVITHESKRIDSLIRKLYRKVEQKTKQ